MGRVYKARDLALDRTIALKTIRSEKANHPEIVKRFKQELLLARQVTHKNIIRIYDFGEDTDGTKFFTMEYIEGKSLKQVLDEKGAFTVQETVDVMRQTLAGLEEAHRQGVVHRDLKPHNIMLDEQGVLRIMDFGIARTDNAEEDHLTDSGQILGTPDYISPEQVKGGAVTSQSDIFAFGVILYELLTKKTPFREENRVATILSRLDRKPTPPRELNSSIPTYMQNMILKCMEVDRELRYKTAREILSDLNRQHVDGSIAVRLRKFAAANANALIAASLAAMAFGGWTLAQRSEFEELVAATDTVSIAVLPIHNVTGQEDIDWMASGISDMLTTDLSQSSVVRPLTHQGVTQVLQNLGKKDQTEFDAETLKVIHDITESDYTLSGKYTASGRKLRFDLQLLERASGLPTPIRVVADATDPFSAVDEMTQQVYARLNLEAEADADRPVHEVTTHSVEAFRAYQAGLEKLRHGAHQASLPFLEQALELDPKFAMAQARLAEAHFRLGNHEQARLAAEQALNHLEQAQLPLTERYQIHAIGALVNNDPEAAVASYEKIVELHPQDPYARYSLANSLELLGDVGKSIEAYEATLTTAPEFAAALLGLGRMLVVNGRNDDSIRVLTDAIAANVFGQDAEALGMVHSIVGIAYRDLSDYERSIQHLQQSLDYRTSIEDQRGVMVTLSNLGSADRRLGRYDESRQRYAQALEMANVAGNRTMQSMALLGLGQVYLESGNTKRALRHLRDSLEIEWERGEHTEIALRLDVIAEVYQRRGQFADALVYLDQANVHLERAEDPMEQARNQSVRADVKRDMALHTEAIAAQLEGLSMYQAIGAKREAGQSQLALAELYIDQGRFSEAFDAISGAETVFGELPVTEGKTKLLLVRARALRILGAEGATEEEMRLARDSLGKNSAHLALQLTLLELEQVATRTKRIPDELAQQATRQAAELLDPRWSIFTEITLSRSLLASHSPDKARDVAAKALKSAAAQRLRHWEAEAGIALAEAELAAQRYVESAERAKRVIELAARFEARPILGRAHHVLGESQLHLGSVPEANASRARARELCETMRELMPSEHRERFSNLARWHVVLTSRDVVQSIRASHKP